MGQIVREGDGGIGNAYRYRRQIHDPFG
jgi:hypothetical protein